jgi:FtsZ-binding cell division protein ZapB
MKSTTANSVLKLQTLAKVDLFENINSADLQKIAKSAMEMELLKMYIEQLKEEKSLLRDEKNSILKERKKIL